MNDTSRDRGFDIEGWMLLGHVLLACLDVWNQPSASTGATLSRVAVAVARVATQRRKTRR